MLYISRFSHRVQVGVYSHRELGLVKLPRDEGQGRDMPSQAQHMLLRPHAGTQLLAAHSCLVTGSKPTQDSTS